METIPQIIIAHYMVLIITLALPIWGALMLKKILK